MDPEGEEEYKEPQVEMEYFVYQYVNVKTVGSDFSVDFGLKLREEEQEPELPTIPLIPLVPTIPVDPEIPEVPEVPEAPEVPEEPEVQVEPAVPETPEEPEQPEVLPLEPEELPSVTTGDDTNYLVYIMMILLSLGITTCILRKKNKE